ncbi:DUF5320 domain-containing protein [Chloroflexota bacterium]
MYYRHGLGFRGASPPWPYVGRGRGGLPRCWHPGEPAAPSYTPPYAGYPAWETVPPPARMTREQETDFLKEEAKAIKSQLEEIEGRIRDMETKEE